MKHITIPPALGAAPADAWWGRPQTGLARREADRPGWRTYTRPGGGAPPPITITPVGEDARMAQRMRQSGPSSRGARGGDTQ